MYIYIFSNKNLHEKGNNNCSSSSGSCSIFHSIKYTMLEKFTMYIKLAGATKSQKVSLQNPLSYYVP